MYIDDELGLILGVVGIVFALFAGIMYADYRVDKHVCYTRFKDYQPEYVGWVTGCMVTIDEQRVPASSVRMTM